MRDHQPSPAAGHEAAVASYLGPDAAREMETVISEHILECEERVLLFVGALLLQHNQAPLWETIYQSVTDDTRPAADREFVEMGAASIRHRYARKPSQD
jgi:hypothetical protein